MILSSIKRNNMNKTLATSLTTALFLVIGISGIMIYFDLFKGNVKDLHEILGLAFVIAVIFHLFFNWKQMKNYFNKKAFLSTALITSIITTGFILSSLYKSPSPKGVVLKSMMNTPITNALNVLDIEYDKAVQTLKNKNITLTKEDTLVSIAKKGNLHPFEVISILSY